MIWSSCLEPVPPILKVLSGWPLRAVTKSLVFLYGASAFTHNTKLSRASICTGVRSRQLKGTPVARGVVNRLDRVMTILWALPLSPFTSKKPSAPAPPDLLTTMMGCALSLFLATTPWIKRAIWSAPPPVPAGTTNSMGLVGSQAWAGAKKLARASSTALCVVRTRVFSFMVSPRVMKK